MSTNQLPEKITNHAGSGAEHIDGGEFQHQFNQTAEARFGKILATKQTIAWQEMRRYLESYITGHTESTRPIAKNWSTQNG